MLYLFDRLCVVNPILQYLSLIRLLVTAIREAIPRNDVGRDIHYLLAGYCIVAAFPKRDKTGPMQSRGPCGNAH